eukprot:TRINITY_DN11439_c0_g1_i1.p1 TRINITY_DN11439_c0_g1~~TRINITY_DN11439_c0_g1_i1.p1  ORF type:complete len:223 (-),score=37.02 TRINITY_DN11439_c0_g1_i1:97-765(-)
MCIRDRWSPCQQHTAFATVIDNSVGYCPTSIPCLVSSPDFVNEGYREQQITTHADVCTPAYVADGRCPRAVVEVLGSLMVAKMSFGAFVAPGLALLLSSQHGSAAREWFMRKVLCKPEGHRFKLSLDTEMAGVVMLLQVPLALGFCVPILVPLAGLAFAGHTLVFQWSMLPLANHARPSSMYLWTSIGVGWAICLLYTSDAADEEDSGDLGGGSIIEKKKNI